MIARRRAILAPLFRPGAQKDMNMTDFFARMDPIGLLHRVMSDGSTVPMPMPMRPPLPRMTEAEIHAAAMSDPDALPMSDEDFARIKRGPRAKTLRRTLGLTQEEFATRFHIPIGTLRDWEQGRSEPDQTARAYLTAIAGDAAAVERALAAAPHR